MTDKDRNAYADLMRLIEDAGYIVVDEEFYSDDMDPGFEADLRLVPPHEK